MKQSHARLTLSLSILLNFLSFLLSLIAFYLPSWKSVELPSTFQLITQNSEHSWIDPLIRGELEKYLDVLYRPGKENSCCCSCFR